METKSKLKKETKTRNVRPKGEEGSKVDSSKLSSKGIQRVAVIGSGSWGTALTKIISSKPEIKIRWWFRDEEASKQFKTLRFNPKHLRDVKLPVSRVRASTDIKRVLDGADLVILAVPSAYILEVLNEVDPNDLEGKIIAASIKGMIPENHMTVSHYLEKEFKVPLKKQCVIGGPCHAEEVALEKQSYLTIASPSKKTAKKVSALLRNHYIEATPNNDLVGVEYSAVMKNIIALASGVVHALNYGDNFQSVLISNAVQEINRFLEEVDPKDRDLTSSAYLGDIMVTAYSQFSRNRTLGNMVGRGYSVRTAMMEMNQVAEGYYGVKSIHEVNKDYGVNLPITNFVYHVLYEKISPAIEVQILKGLLK